MSSSTSKREYAIDYVGKGKKGGATSGGGNVLLNAGVHRLDGPEHSGASDLTRLDASSSAHGLLPKLSGSVLDLFRGDGTFGTAPFATPAIVLGTAAASGAASTVIRSDATIVAFDATVPVTQAVGDSAATGSAAVAARRDHKHAVTRPSLDDLSDVVITSAATGDRVRFNGSNFVNSALRWEPHVDYTGSVVLDGNGDPVMVEVA